MNFSLLNLFYCLLLYKISSIAPVVELVDTIDSKSFACKGVLVQVRPGAPIILYDIYSLI